MTEQVLPPLPADDGSCRIELYGPPAGYTYLWDQATWDSAAKWEGVGWQDVTPKSMNVQITWGTDDVAGVLSLPAAGSWNIATYDPDRILDPSNVTSPFQPVLRPGGLIRVSYLHDSVREVVRQGVIDTVDFDMATKVGSIRGSDGISVMAKALVREGNAASAPDTLRARARWALNLAGIGYIEVEPDPASGDPLVGPATNDEAAVWTHITVTALDALHAVWVDRNSVLRFRSFGDRRMTGVELGSNGVPIDTLGTRATLENTYNVIRSMNLAGTFDEAQNGESVSMFGQLALTRSRPLATSYEWVQRVRDDRSGSHPQFIVGTIRPRTRDEFLSILNLGMVDQVAVRVWSEPSPVNQNVVVVGGRIEANTDSGWSAELAVYIPGWQWQELPSIVVRKLSAIQASDIWLDELGQTYGNVNGGAVRKSDLTRSPEIGEMGNVRAAMLTQFPVIDFTGVKAIRAAILRLEYQNNDSFQGGKWDPQDETLVDFRIESIGAAWDNMTVEWPGPPIIARADYPDHVSSEGRVQEFDVLGFILRWAPPSLGGSSEAQHGLKISPIAIELNPEASAVFIGNTRPQLLVYLEV